MANVDSAPVFDARVQELGLDALSNAFAAQGWTTFGNFANAAAGTPASLTEQIFVRDILTPLVGAEAAAAGDPRKSAIRRLHAESYAAFAMDMQRRMDRLAAPPPLTS